MKHIKLFRCTLAIFLSLAVLSGYAGEFPSTIKYEGSFPNSRGKPVRGLVTIVFRLYTSESGGAAIWQETQNIKVRRNKFSVELGSTTAINFQDLNSALYLGFALDGGPEVTPRQPLPLLPYSVRAMDAKTVSGFSPGALDQSAHVNDTNNPHNVTVEQLGLQPTTSGSALYTGNAYCGDATKISLISTCYTRGYDSGTNRKCGPFSWCPILYYYDCSGNKTTSRTPFTCPAVLLGYLASP